MDIREGPEKKKRGRPKSTEIKPPQEKPPKKPTKVKVVIEKPPPRKRGRKSKAELELIKNQSLNSSILEENTSFMSQEKKSESDEFPKIEPENYTDLPKPIHNDLQSNVEEQMIKEEKISNLETESKDIIQNQNENLRKDSIIETDALPNSMTISEEKVEPSPNKIKEEIAKETESPGISRGMIFSSEYENLVEEPLSNSVEKSKSANKENEGSTQLPNGNSLQAEENSKSSQKFDFIKYFSQPQEPKCCSDIFNPQLYARKCLKRPFEHKFEEESMINKKIKHE